MVNESQALTLTTRFAKKSGLPISREIPGKSATRAIRARLFDYHPDEGAMHSVEELLNGRADPGIIIFNFKKQVMYANQVAWALINEHHPGSNSSDRSYNRFKIPDEIKRVYNELKERLITFAKNSCPEAVYLKKIVSIGNNFFFVRGFIITGENKGSAVNFLLLVDKIAARTKIDLRDSCAHYQLSQREFQVVEALVQGLTNKEIANKLGVVEATAKEHLRKIMSKVGATTRTGLAARLLSFSNPAPSHIRPSVTAASKPNAKFA